jgi:hypothetical protein
MGYITLSSIVATISVLPATLAVYSYTRHQRLLTYVCAHAAIAGFAVAIAASPPFAPHTTGVLGKVSSIQSCSLQRMIGAVTSWNASHCDGIIAQSTSTLSRSHAEGGWQDCALGLGPLVAVPPGTAHEACAAAATHHRAGMEQGGRWLVRNILSDRGCIGCFLVSIIVLFYFPCMACTYQSSAKLLSAGTWGAGWERASRCQLMRVPFWTSPASCRCAPSTGLASG